MFRLTRVVKSQLSVSSVVVRTTHVWTSEKVVKSPFRDVVVPDVTAYEYVWRNLDKWPTKIAAVCGVTKRRYTYEQVYKQSQIFGANLRKKFQVFDGDTVAIMMSNFPEYVIVVNGILAAGGIVTTLNPVYTVDDVQNQLTSSNASVIVVLPHVVPIVQNALKQCKKKLPIIVLDMEQDLPEGTVSYKELVEANRIDLSILKIVNRSSKDVAFLPYSSGTTGLPKGVELTNSVVVSNFEQQNTECRIFSYTTENNQDATLVVLPMFHAYGLLLVMMHKLSAGLQLVTLPAFDPRTFLNSLVDYKIKVLFLVPPIVMFLGTHPEVTSKHLEHLKCIISGAAPLAPADIDNLSKKLRPDTQFAQGYGMTELGPLATFSPLGSNSPMSSSGYALPNIELRIVDEEMKNLGPNEGGELLIRGPNIMKGYRNNPQANKEVFLEDGWFRTGDIAAIDENGLVYITDRLKELIKVNALQVAPAELENILKEHPAVFDAAVVGIRDDLTGQKPKAFVVLKDGFKADADDITKFVSQKVAPFKRLKEVMFLDSIPKTPSGKILRKVLKEKFC